MFKLKMPLSLYARLVLAMVFAIVAVGAGYTYLRMHVIDVPQYWRDVRQSIVGVEEKPQVSGAIYQGRTETVFALFDAVGLHHKNGLTEVYGAVLRPRQAGPLRLAGNELHVEDDRAWVLWSPDYSPASGATHLVLTLHKAIEHGRLYVLLETRGGQRYMFQSPDRRAATPVDPKPCRLWFRRNWRAFCIRRRLCPSLPARTRPSSLSCPKRLFPNSRARRVRGHSRHYELREKEFPNRVFNHLDAVIAQLRAGLPRLAEDHNRGA